MSLNRVERLQFIGVTLHDECGASCESLCERLSVSCSYLSFRVNIEVCAIIEQRFSEFFFTAPYFSIAFCRVNIAKYFLTVFFLDVRKKIYCNKT